MDFKPQQLSRKLLLRLFPLSSVQQAVTQSSALSAPPCAAVTRWMAVRISAVARHQPRRDWPADQPTATAAQPSGRQECGSDQRCGEEIKQIRPPTMARSPFHNLNPQLYFLLSDCRCTNQKLPACTAVLFMRPILNLPFWVDYF